MLNNSTGNGNIGQLVKFVNSLGNMLLKPIATTDSIGAVGIVLSLSYPADLPYNKPAALQIALSGVATCNFDGAATVGDYVTISRTVAGNCHDAGGGLPLNGGQVIGRVVGSNGGSAPYQVVLFNTELRTAPRTSGKFTFAGLTANSSQQIFTNTNATTFTYRINVYFNGSGDTNSFPTLNLAWTDETGSQTLPASVSTSCNGSTCKYLGSSVAVVRSATSTPVAFTTSGISGTANYNVYFVVEMIDKD